MNELQDIQDEMMEIIKQKLVNAPPSAFRLWFGGMKLTQLSNYYGTFSVPTPLCAEILSTRYEDIILDALEEVIGFRVQFKVYSLNMGFEADKLPEEERPKESDIERAEREERERKINSLIEAKPAAEGEPQNLLESYTFDNFIEGSSNRFAKAACLAVAAAPAQDYNPLFIHGHSGLGKTHLLCAVVNYLKEHHPKMKIVYKKSEDFINELVAAISTNSTASFKERYRTADVLLIDDIQFIAGKESMQEEFFHTFSTLYESGKQIILTSDRPPNEIRPLEDRLRTRFEGGLIADIQPPTQELRAAIIRSKAEQMEIDFPNELIEYTAERLHDDIRQIEGVMLRLSAYQTLVHCVPFDKHLIDHVISIIDPGNIPSDIVIDRILREVSEYYGVSIEDLKSKKKTDNIAKARHIAIYIIRKLTEKSYKEVGDIFFRDHTTVMASCNKVEVDIKTVKNTESDIRKIIRKVRGLNGGNQ